MKYLICLACLLITSFSYSQAYVGMEAGNRMGINAGMIYRNVEFKGGALFPYSRTTILSNDTYAQIGYKLSYKLGYEVTMLTGIAHYHNTIKGIFAIDKTCLTTSIELGKDFTTVANHFGNYYLFIAHAHEMYYGAGLKIYVK